MSELIRNKVVTVTHEWDEASSDLEPGVRSAVHAALGEQGLPSVTVERLVQCEIARQIHWLNTTGCTYFDIAVPETEAEVACYREAEQVAARAGDDCWQKFGPSAEKGR